MPGIDIALILLAVAGAGLVLLRGDWWAGLRWSYAAAATGAVALQIARDELHWQALPAYLAVGLLGWLLFRRSRRRIRRLTTAALALNAVTVALLWMLPVFELPLPTGSFEVGTTGPLDWGGSGEGAPGEGSAGGREVVAQVWYPAEAGASGVRARYARFGELKPLKSYQIAVRTNSVVDAPLAKHSAPFPVLIYGHSWGVGRMHDTFLVEELASHGYVVIALDHPGNALRMELHDGRVVKSDRAHALDNLEAGSVSAVEALWSKELALWVADDRAALDRLASLGKFSGQLDMDRVGAFGHSFGGAASMALLGQDPRVKCAVNLDGWTLGGIDRRTTQPAMFVYEGGAEARGPGSGVEWELDRDDNAAIDASLARFGGYRAYVAGTQHADFTDQTLFSPLRSLTHTGPIAGERIRTILRGLLLGFFDETLREQVDVPQFPEVKMRRWPMPRQP